MLAVLLIVLHEHFASLLVQSTLRKRYNQQTFYDLQDVVKGPRGGIPVFFKSINAYLSLFGDVRMENFGDEVACMSVLVTFWRVIGEIVFDCKFASEDATFVGCTERSIDFCYNICHIGLINDHPNAYLHPSMITIW